MPRYQNPADINFYQGSPVPNGQLFFFVSGTSTPKQTYADAAEKIENPHPVLLDSAGREPNIFYSGSAKVVLRDAAGVQIWERDPVGGDLTAGNFSEYNELIIYNESDIVQGSDGRYYISLTSGNQGNDPVDDDGTNWNKIDFVTNSVNETELETLKINILNSESAPYVLPDSSLIKDGESVFCWKPERYDLLKPIIDTFSGADLITFSGGTDTQVEVDKSQTFAFIKNGANNWDLVI